MWRNSRSCRLAKAIACKVSSHSWSTPDAYPRIYKLGGFITPYAGDSTGFVEKWRKHLQWADPRYYFGFGYGADMNGLGAQGDPRGAGVANPVTYPFKGIEGATITPTARLLAGADAYQAMIEPRPHRAALSPADAARELQAEVRVGRLDADAVEAVLAASGQPTQRRRANVGGLTSRELDVLRLAARGLSNRDIAHLLTITPKTVGNHIEHIYTKIDETNRAGAALFAMRNGLVTSDKLGAERP